MENRDLIVGIKVRLSDSIANDGKNEHEAYRQVLNLRLGFLFVFIYSQFKKYMFNSILKTVCCLETRYPFCVWIFALYSKSYFFVCESVVFIYERYA